MSGFSARLGESAGAFRGNFGNPNLRRIQLAGLGSVWGCGRTALPRRVRLRGRRGERGRDRHLSGDPGGATAPFTSTLADRPPARAVSRFTNLGRAAASAPPASSRCRAARWLVYVLAALAAILGTAFLPAEAAFFPALARTPEELTAANVAQHDRERRHSPGRRSRALLAFWPRGACRSGRAAPGVALVALIRVGNAACGDGRARARWVPARGGRGGDRLRPEACIIVGPYSARDRAGVDFVLMSSPHSSCWGAVTRRSAC